MRKLLLVCIVLVWFPLLWSQTTLSLRIDRLIESLPKGSEVGISVYDLTDKKSLYTYRDTKLSRPASTMKLLTAITSLARPDADEPFRTEVWYKGIIERDTLQGDLYVVGGFDPEFDEQAMNHLLNFPFTHINGKVYADVSMKDSLYWGSGWAWDDTPEAYQPYLSPLMYHKGVVTVTIAPALKQGNPALITCVPASSYYTLSNSTRTHTPSAGKLTVTRDWLHQANNITVSGNVESRRREELSVYSSQEFFMHLFLEKLRSKGVSVSPRYEFIPFVADSTAVCITRWECSVQDVIHRMMKQSDNLNAEALLWRLGVKSTRKAHVSAKDGITEITRLIRYLGHNPDLYKIADGCGLSNYDYLSPALLVDFLKFAYARTDVFQCLYKSLPIAGVDGTLIARMKAGKAHKNVHAKTGSYTAINALSGYLKAANGHEIAFAIMNQNILSSSRAREFQDSVCEALCK